MRTFVHGLIASILTMAGANAFAHGQDKPGPHGGAIQMPGAFHTEVVDKKTSFEVFLLDINFSNPSVKNSSVEAFVVKSGKKSELQCSQGTESFVCKGTNSTGKSGQLHILAKRENSQGNEVVYELPLKPGKTGAM
jgi:hypothetical protein